MSDSILPFQIGEGAARGRLVRLKDSLGPILGEGLYPAPVAGLLAQMLALATALAGGLKYKGVFTLQAQGDGPVRLLVADVTSEGGLRGTARFDPARLGSAASLAELLGEGVLAFTVDQGPDTERYQGIVALEGETLASCAEIYFSRSEQIATRVALDAAANGGGWNAAALILQRMPADGPGRPILTKDEADDRWTTAQALMTTLGGAELLDGALAPDALLHRLFHAESLQCFPPREIEARCRCSEDKVAGALRSFSDDAIASLKDEHGLVSATCEFCRSVYTFDDEALARLRADR